jgi:hypothetical protein
LDGTLGGVAMSALFPISLMLAIFCVWVVTAIQSGRLYHRFLAKYPKEAERLIPFAFSNTRHPEQFLFFFRKASRPMLRADECLWKLHQKLKVLLLASVLAPLASLAFLVFRFAVHR